MYIQIECVCSESYGQNGGEFMATQSFIKSFSVNRKNAEKMGKVLNSRKKMTFTKDFSVEQVGPAKIRDFFGMGQKENSAEK